jgi:hypothetical protein
METLDPFPRKWSAEPLQNKRTTPRRECGVENRDWQETVEALVDAKRCRATAWRILDGTDGAAAGVEHTLNAALASIDAVYAIEHVHTYNADVASSAAVQEFWEQHGELPGFAIGT